VSQDGDFLSRWSRRKHASRRGEVEEAPAKAPAVATPAPSSVEPPKDEEPLPPVESLTPESDFTPFMRGDVDPGLRRQALRTLFRDPRFNVMDGLDVYIDDFSKPDPIPEEWLGQLQQMARLGDYALTLEKEREAAKEAAKEATPGLIHDENQAVAEEPEVSESDAQTRQPPADSQQT
jgi:hypothetical protein